jgi:hypothetical protein
MQNELDGLDGLAVGMAIFDEEIELGETREVVAQRGAAALSGRLAKLTVKLSIVSALGFAVFAAAQAMAILP